MSYNQTIVVQTAPPTVQQSNYIKLKKKKKKRSVFLNILSEVFLK